MSLYKLSVEKIEKGQIFLEAPSITDENGNAFETAQMDSRNAYISICKGNVPFVVRRGDVLEVEVSMKEGKVTVVRKLPEERRRRELKRDLVEKLQKK